MAYIDYSAHFVYKGLLTYQEANQLGANDEYFKSGNVTVTGLWGWSINSASNALSVDQDGAGYGLTITAQNCINVRQDISGGRCFDVRRNLGGAEVNPMVYLYEEHASCTMPVLRIDNAGSGNDITAPSFSLINGYIAPGNNEAMRWDIVVFDLDGTSHDSVAYSLTGTKVRVQVATGYDVTLSTSLATTDVANTHYLRAEFVSSATLNIYYGGGWVSGDDVYVLMMYVA